MLQSRLLVTNGLSLLGGAACAVTCSRWVGRRDQLWVGVWGSALSVGPGLPMVAAPVGQDRPLSAGSPSSEHDGCGAFGEIQGIHNKKYFLLSASWSVLWAETWP